MVEEASNHGEMNLQQMGLGQLAATWTKIRLAPILPHSEAKRPSQVQDKNWVPSFPTRASGGSEWESTGSRQAKVSGSACVEPRPLGGKHVTAEDTQSGV